MKHRRPKTIELALSIWAVCALAALGCGDSEASGDPKADTSDHQQNAAEPMEAADAPKREEGSPDAFLADAGDGWKTLITGKWELEPGAEGYRCVRYTLPEDVYFGGVRALIPLGTHHTVLTVGDDTSTPDGITTCTASTNAQRQIAGSGVGTNEYFLPKGVAVRLRAGQQLLLNLHLFNVSEEPLSGTSGTLIKTVDASEIEHTADIALAGPINLSIPVGGPTVQSGNCTFTQDSTLLAVVPHMHQLGIHLKATAHSSIDGDVVIHDAAYDFDEQLVYPFDKPVRMKTGDKLQVDCTYMNTTDKLVNFGNSSLEEMCFAGIVRYPETVGSFLCAN